MRRFAFLALGLLSCTRPAPRPEFALKVAVVGALEPLRHDTSSSYTTLAQDIVYDTVLRPEIHGNVSRVLASWERQGRGLRALVAEGVTFSDGSSVTPEDVARTCEAAGLKVRRGGRWLWIEPGASGLPVEAVLAMTGVWKPVAGGEVGTGPFRMVSEDGNRIALERVRPAPGRVARVEIVAFSSTRESFARALKGEVNAVAPLDLRQVELMEGVTHLRVIRAPSPHAIIVHLNPRRLDRGLRRTLVEALPVEEIAEIALGRSRDSRPARATHRPTELAPGSRLRVIAPLLSASLQQTGLAVRRGLGIRGGELIRLSMRDAFVHRDEYDVIVDSILAWPPGMDALYWHSGALFSFGYSNPAYDQAIDAGDLARAEAELKKDPPALIIGRRDRIVAVDARLKNATLGAWGVFDTLPDWEVSP